MADWGANPRHAYISQSPRRHIIVITSVQRVSGSLKRSTLLLFFFRFLLSVSKSNCVLATNTFTDFSINVNRATSKTAPSNAEVRAIKCVKYNIRWWAMRCGAEDSSSAHRDKDTFSVCNPSHSRSHVIHSHRSHSSAPVYRTMISHTQMTTWYFMHNWIWWRLHHLLSFFSHSVERLILWGRTKPKINSFWSLLVVYCPLSSSYTVTLLIIFDKMWLLLVNFFIFSVGSWCFLL